MKVLILIFLALFTSCSAQQVNVPPPTLTPISPVPTPESKPPEPPLEEKKTQIPQNTPRTKGLVEKKMEKYLLSREIKPVLTIKNDYNGVRDEREETIKVLNHKIIWFHSFEETKIKIDEDLFSLTDQVSLNNATDERKIKGNYVDNWNEIKLYNVKHRKLILISMNPVFCTGLMCSVSFYLVYDLKTQSKNFFGTFKTNMELSLYDFNLDGKIDYLTKTYKSNGSLGIASEIQNIYNLYTINKKGKFRLQKDKKQNPYFIKRAFDADTHEEFNNKFEQNWIEEIK